MSKIMESKMARARGNALALLAVLSPEAQLEILEGLAEDVDRVLLDDITRETKDAAGKGGRVLQFPTRGQALPGMTWGNEGEVWHIVHNTPMREYDLADPDQMKRYFNWSNLGPARIHDAMAAAVKTKPAGKGAKG